MEKLEYKIRIIQKKILELLKVKGLQFSEISYELRLETSKRIIHLYLLSEIELIKIYFNKGKKMAKLIKTNWKNSKFSLPKICYLILKLLKERDMSLYSVGCKIDGYKDFRDYKDCSGSKTAEIILILCKMGYINEYHTNNVHYVSLNQNIRIIMEQPKKDFIHL